MDFLKKGGKFLLLGAAIVLVFCGCVSVDDITSGNLMAKTEARMGQAVADAMGIGALEDAVLATLIYTQVFYAGGYGYGYDDFSEGEGVAWKLTAKDDSGSETLQVERALLKRNADGSAWWFLAYKAENEEEFISEVLLDADYNILKFRYHDPETDAIREWIPEKDEDAEQAADDEEMDEEPQVGYFEGDYGDYVTGTERVVVPAGTYQAEHVLIEDSYTAEDGTEASESYEVRYEWWLVKDVPGDLVKYSWQNVSDDSSLVGELLSHTRGYTTRLKSF
ncbi:hypothetical protein [Marispirochaeta sp.]|uniref:hypothetical protein n=1 Tax=Marispirochaeta sp. TaxID=2038653 RepID=UPI0029C8CD90|nr:hypothetical protein [Marispirochaeta sp.]